jgi:SAM-dependent methyltransferase
MDQKIADIVRKVSNYYTNKVLTHGPTPQGVDWNGPESQNIRFIQLSKVLSPSPSEYFSVLDFGCGYGALLEFLNKRYQKIRYTGFDISSKMISQAKMLYPSILFTSEASQLSSHDYVIASGVFNVRLDISSEDWERYVKSTLEVINHLAIKGFSFNILTSYSDKEKIKDHLYYANPCFYFDYCMKNFSRKVALLHDYELYEFTIIVRR